jgi:hypothetical protein
MPPPRRTIRALAALGWCACAVACGPSYQALYEGDARFEHCYALEENGAAGMPQKSECWRDWTSRYTYGQTRDRIEYAAARLRALQLAPVAPTDEAMMQAAPGEGRASSIDAPAPTSAFEPPPNTLAPDAGMVQRSALPVGFIDAGAELVTEEKSADPPGTACGTGCDATWSRCKTTCDGKAKCDACVRTYKRCMRNCFAK